MLAAGLLRPLPACAQQPFVTDDTNVTPKGKLHFKFTNESDILQRSSFPNLKQNTSSFTLNYGLFDKFEVGINGPLIAIQCARHKSTHCLRGWRHGPIDQIQLSRGAARLAASSDGISFNVELPTGDKDRQLGSALVDYQLNGIVQTARTERTKLRLNSGVLFSGNVLTGAIGIKTRGTVFTGGASLVRQFTKRLDLGAEVTGTITKEFQLGKGRLQFQMGGKLRLKEGFTFDFGIIGGRYSASPRFGLQLGAC